MPNRIIQNRKSLWAVIPLVILLVLVRMFEKHLFYDPFLHYFQGDYLHFPLPQYDGLRLFLGLLFRYFLNTIFSLGIIYALFKDRELLGFVTVLYLLLFVVLLLCFYAVIHYFGNQQNLLLFYLRRFLIQPLFLLLFVPAFYYQKLKN